MHPLFDLPYGELPDHVEDGVMFTTYQSLIAKSNKTDQSRLDQLVAWAADAYNGDERAFDGCLVFDEAHRAKNLATEGKGGKSAKTASAVTEIQARLPNARVLYVSATAASKTKDLGYMTRLGLWGPGTAFADFGSFASQMGERAMEVVAMDMKARGMFTSRMLAFTGCSFEKKECKLSASERDMYDAATAWWSQLHVAMDRCIALTHESEASKKAFWGAHQAFFKQMLNSLKTRFAIAIAEETLAKEPPECVVIGLLSTGDAKATEAVEREMRLGNELDSGVSNAHH